MPKYLIKAYGDYERRLKQKTKIITAENEEEAWIEAWKTFPEYKELGVFVYKEAESDGRSQMD